MGLKSKSLPCTTMEEHPRKVDRGSHRFLKLKGGPRLEMPKYHWATQLHQAVLLHDLFQYVYGSLVKVTRTGQTPQWRFFRRAEKLSSAFTCMVKRRKSLLLSQRVLWSSVISFASLPNSFWWCWDLSKDVAAPIDARSISLSCCLGAKQNVGELAFPTSV